MATLLTLRTDNARSLESDDSQATRSRSHSSPERLTSDVASKHLNAKHKPSNFDYEAMSAFYLGLIGDQGCGSIFFNTKY